MSDGEDSFEAARREVTERLFEAKSQGHEVGYGLDKALIFLSAGSLVFSMTFVSVLAPGKHWLVMLFLAWTCFGGSIVCVIIGMRMSQVAVGRWAERLSEALKEIDKRRAPGVSVRADYETTRNPRASLLNICAVGACLVGILFLGIFVGVNLWCGR
jgi:hypothetical protein